MSYSSTNTRGGTAKTRYGILIYKYKGAAKTWYGFFFYKYRGQLRHGIGSTSTNTREGGQLRHGMGSSSTNTRGGRGS